MFSCDSLSTAVRNCPKLYINIRVSGKHEALTKLTLCLSESAPWSAESYGQRTKKLCPSSWQYTKDASSVSVFDSTGATASANHCPV